MSPYRSRATVIGAERDRITDPVRGVCITCRRDGTIETRNCTSLAQADAYVEEREWTFVWVLFLSHQTGQVIAEYQGIYQLG